LTAVPSPAQGSRILIKPSFAGLQEKISFGLSYRGLNKAYHGHGPLRVTVGLEDLNTGDPVMGARLPWVTIVNFCGFSPRQISAGIALKPTKGLTLASEITWKGWSEYRTYLDLWPIPEFEDTYTYRGGSEYTWYPAFSLRILKSITRICLRAGYYYEPSPVQTLDPGYVYLNIPSDNIFDSDLDVFSLGFCLTLAGETMEHEIELFSQYHHLRPYTRMTFIDSIYAYQYNIPPRDEYFPVEISGKAWAIGGGYTIRF